jgi:hypothetical protein
MPTPLKSNSAREQYAPLRVRIQGWRNRLPHFIFITVRGPQAHWDKAEAPTPQTLAGFTPNGAELLRAPTRKPGGGAG